MTDFTEVYLRGMAYDLQLSFEDQFIPCEICDQRAADVHHIDARGMGGTTKEPHVRDLMALCREDHELYGDRKDAKKLLRTIHRLRMYARRIMIATNRLMIA